MRAERHSDRHTDTLIAILRILTGGEAITTQVTDEISA